MKKFLTIFISFALAVCTVFSATITVMANEVEKDNKYVYPITEKSSQWKQFDHQEMLDAIQIPDDEIKKMDTQKLLDAVLDYPLLGDIYAYNSTQTGFKVIRSEFNALDEIFKRKDAYPIIFNKYINTEIIPENSNLDSIDFNEYNMLAFLELFLVQPELKNSVDKVIINNAEQKIIEKCNKKSYEIYGTRQYEYFLMSDEIDSYSSYSMNESGISEKLSVLSNADEYNSGYSVKTPKGSSVPVLKLKAGKDFSKSVKAENDAYIKTRYPGITIISPSTKKYNCHSYAWYSASQSNPYWMNNPAKYMSDDSYKKTGYRVGVRIYYGGVSDKEHSGIVSNVRVGYAGCYVKSKWGQYGLMNHFYNNCPYYTKSTKLTYWTR